MWAPLVSWKMSTQYSGSQFCCHSRHSIFDPNVSFFWTDVSNKLTFMKPQKKNSREVISRAGRPFRPIPAIHLYLSIPSNASIRKFVDHQLMKSKKSLNFVYYSFIDFTSRLFLPQNRKKWCSRTNITQKWAIWIHGTIECIVNFPLTTL